MVAGPAQADVIKHVELLDEVKNGPYDRAPADAGGRVPRSAASDLTWTSSAGAAQ